MHKKDNALNIADDWEKQIEPYLIKLESLENHKEELYDSYKGLIDIDNYSEIIILNLKISYLLMKNKITKKNDERKKLIKKHFFKALSTLEFIITENISVDQKPEIIDFFLKNEEIISLMKVILNNSDADLFDFDDKMNKKQIMKLNKIIAKAILKFTDKEWIKDEASIQEGEEDLIFSEKMSLPISQAIHLIENEFIPKYEKELHESPGNEEIQYKIDLLHERLKLFYDSNAVMRTMPLMPIEKLYSDIIAGFTPDGEIMVSLKMPVISYSGNVLDKLKKDIEIEIINNLIGKKISDEVDRGYKEATRKIKGKSKKIYDVLSFMDINRLFKGLIFKFPFLRSLDNKTFFSKLVDSGIKKEKHKIIELLNKNAEESNKIISDHALRLIDNNSNNK